MEKVYAVVARSAFRSQNVQNHTIFRAPFEVRMWFCMAGAKDSAHYQERAKRKVFVAVSKTLAGVGHLKRICEDACRMAGAIQETCSPEMLGGTSRALIS